MFALKLRVPFQLRLKPARQRGYPRQGGWRPWQREEGRGGVAERDESNAHVFSLCGGSEMPSLAGCLSNKLPITGLRIPVNSTLALSSGVCMCAGMERGIPWPVSIRRVCPPVIISLMRDKAGDDN